MTPWIRESTEIKIEAAANSLLQKFLGLLLMALGAGLGYADYRAAMNAKESLHGFHAALAVSLIVFGALVGFAPFVKPVVVQLWVWAGQTSIPFVGGRRKDDPPAPETKQ